MHINTSVDNSIAFEATNKNSLDRSDEDLAKQASEFSQLLNQTQKSDEVSYQTSTNNQDSITTTFEDPRNGKMVAVSLNKDIVLKLEEFFGKSDIRRNDDGTATLDNKAESYVAGWFEDIAYNREFLKADENNDGQISRSEYNQTKNNFEANIKVTVTSGEKVTVDVSESINKSYINAYEDDSYTSLYRSNNRAKSLDDELNMTLSIDKDFNSKIDINEAYSTDKDMKKEDIFRAHINSLNIEDVVRKKSEEVSEEDLKNDITRSFTDILSIIVTLLLNSDDEKVKETLDKLKENDGELYSLDAVELEILEDILKLTPTNGKFKMEDIDNAIDLLNKYEIKGKSIEEEKTLEGMSDKVLT